MRKTAIRLVLIIIALLALSATAGIAGDDGDIIGYWESYDYDSGEVFRIDFAEDGMFYAEIWNFDMSYYVIDEANGEVGFTELDGEDAEFDWMFYDVEDEYLALEDEEALMELVMMWEPPKPAHVLDATWMLLLDNEELDSEEDMMIMYITFTAEGTVVMEDLDDEIMGTFFVDAKDETIELIMDEGTDDEHVELGEYFISNGMLTLIFDDEPKTFERLF